DPNRGAGCATTRRNHYLELFECCYPSGRKWISEADPASAQDGCASKAYVPGRLYGGRVLRHHCRHHLREQLVCWTIRPNDHYPCSDRSSRPEQRQQGCQSSVGFPCRSWRRRECNGKSRVQGKEPGSDPASGISDEPGTDALVRNEYRLKSGSI